MAIFLGVDTGGTYTDAVILDEAANAVRGAKDRVISTDSSKVKVCIIPTNEEVGIAQDIVDNFSK